MLLQMLACINCSCGCLYSNAWVKVMMMMMMMMMMMIIDDDDDDDDADFIAPPKSMLKQHAQRSKVIRVSCKGLMKC